MAVIEKERLKAYLGRSEAAYWAAAIVYENLLYPRHIVRQGLIARALPFTAPRMSDAPKQSLITWDLELPGCNDKLDLVNWLRANGAGIREGGHTFYVPPHPALRAILKPLVNFYPEGSGFKILKDFRHPTRARYLYKHRYSLGLLSRLIGSPQDQILAANYMYWHGIGARVWDLACWRIAGECCTVFVVDHVEGTVPTLDQCEAFLDRLRYLNETSHLRVLIPGWEHHPEFAPPYCNGNVVHSDKYGHGLYVDFQNFGLRNRRGWSRDLAATSAPHDRDAATRASWSVVRQLLKQRSRGFDGRIVLEIGCTSSLAISAALAGGAKWAIAWCDHAYARHVEESLLASGSTRFSVIDTEPAPDALEDAIPPNLRARLFDAFVLWRIREGNHTLLDQLIGMPWETLVCVGDGQDHAVRAMERLNALPADQFDVIARSASDGAGAHVTVVCRRQR